MISGTSIDGLHGLQGDVAADGLTVGDNAVAGNVVAEHLLNRDDGRRDQAQKMRENQVLVLPAQVGKTLGNRGLGRVVVEIIVSNFLGGGDLGRLILTSDNGVQSNRNALYRITVTLYANYRDTYFV